MDLISGRLAVPMVLGNPTLLVRETLERPKMVAMGAPDPTAGLGTGPPKPFWASNPKIPLDLRALATAG